MNHSCRLLAAIICTPALVGIAACSESPGQGAAIAPVSTSASVSALSAVTGCADLGGTVAADQTCHLQSTGNDYRIEMSYPLDYPDQKAVTDFIRRKRDDFVDYVKDGTAYMRPVPYSLEVTGEEYHSGTAESGTQSLVFTINDDTGAAHEAHPDTYYQAINYDLCTRSPITLDTLFKPSAQPLKVLSSIVEPQLVKRWGPAVLEPLHDDGMAAYRNFAITDDAIIFFFGEDQLMPQNNGPLQLTVPRSELQSVMT